MNTLSPAAIPQGSFFTPREPIAIGRAKAHPGQVFWVTDSAVTRAQRGCICLARTTQGMGEAKAFSFADFDRYFQPVADIAAERRKAREWKQSRSMAPAALEISAYKPSRFHSINGRGNVIAFHYPTAARQFVSYCHAGQRVAKIA